MKKHHGGLRFNLTNRMDFLSANIVLETAFLAYAPDENDKPTAVWVIEFRDRPAFHDDGAYQPKENFETDESVGSGRTNSFPLVVRPWISDRRLFSPHRTPSRLV
jgi:hypothetical protein